jgi:hypothetical protein
MRTDDPLRAPWKLLCVALAGALALALALASLAAARTDLTHTYHLKRCQGTVHAGFTPGERAHARHYGRYANLSCRRARAIIRLIDHVNGPYPAGYAWSTPHGPPSSWPTVFHHVLHATYLSPDGDHGSRSSPGVAVVLFD